VRRGVSSAALVVGLSLPVLLAAAPARAYVRYQTETGLPFAWPATCIGLIAYPSDLADMMPPDQVLGAASAAAAAWSFPATPDTALDIQVASATGPAPTAIFDRQNSLIFRRDSWCMATDPPGTCSYNPAALALTTLFARRSTGEILDADIEINAKLFVWADVESAPAHPADGQQDLQNALTHELGHLIGLDHTCADPDGPRPLDNLGQPVPDCEGAPPEIVETTMFPSAAAGDTAKRTLAPDDQLAARELYPALAGQPPSVCPTPVPRGPDPAPGCRLAGAEDASGRGAGALAALALAAVMARRRRSPRRG
jgi:hypothetical protein